MIQVIGVISTVLLVGASVAKCAEPIHSAGAPLQSLEKNIMAEADVKRIRGNQCLTGWWFQIFFIFTPTWGRFPI